MTTKKTVLKAVKEKEFIKTFVTANILESMNFWNKQGAEVIEKNKSGEWGDKITQAKAITMQEDDFLLECLLKDCITFCKGKSAAGQYEAGRTRSHIWLHFKNERILLIHA